MTYRMEWNMTLLTFESHLDWMTAERLQSPDALDMGTYAREQAWNDPRILSTLSPEYAA